MDGTNYSIIQIISLMKFCYWNQMHLVNTPKSTIFLIHEHLIQMHASSIPKATILN